MQLGSPNLHARQTDRRFFRVWTVSQSRDKKTDAASDENIADVGLCTLVSTGGTGGRFPAGIPPRCVTSPQANSAS